MGERVEKRLALDPNPVHILVGASESGTSLKIQDSRAPQTRARCLSPMAHTALLSTARRPALRQNCRKLFARAKRRAEKRDVGAASQVDARGLSGESLLVDAEDEPARRFRQPIDRARQSAAAGWDRTRLACRGGGRLAYMSIDGRARASQRDALTAARGSHPSRAKSHVISGADLPEIMEMRSAARRGCGWLRQAAVALAP